MNNPEISVIIPAYNIREYIGKCLDSVLAQDLTDKNMMEIIAVDDGSTDGTAEVLDGYAAKDGRIHVIHKENGGVSAARNDGIALEPVAAPSVSRELRICRDERKPFRTKPLPGSAG